jgi:transposase
MTYRLKGCVYAYQSIPLEQSKWRHGAHYLLCKGIEKATGELGLSFLAYNLKRAINLVGTKKLVEAMGG